jgi:hypothetical protein
VLVTIEDAEAPLTTDAKRPRAPVLIQAGALVPVVTFG